MKLAKLAQRACSPAKPVTLALLHEKVQGLVETKAKSWYGGLRNVATL